MHPKDDANAMLRSAFRAALHRTLAEEIGLYEGDDVELYLADMLAAFIHNDTIYGLRDAEGARIESLADMLVEGDVRLKATNFDREREVHRHIGDFLLFWSGVFPEMLNSLRGFRSGEPEREAIAQGQFSYGIVSSFDHAPYGLEAPTFKKLSANFEGYRDGLRLLRASFEGFRRQGWNDGFQA